MGRFVNQPFLFIAIILFSFSTFAGGTIAGKITIIKGHVLIIRDFNKLIAKKNDTVLESDIIEALAGGTARITLIDSNLVDIYPKSKVEISKYIYKPNKDQKKVELRVDFGKIKATVNQKYDGAKHTYEVKTPSAVAGVRGTVFTAEYDPVKRTSEIVTIEGLVAVNKIIEISEKQGAPVFVKPNHIVNINSQTAKEDQPRELKQEEREKRQKDDADLGYKYDPRSAEQPAAAPAPATVPSSQIKSPKKQIPSEEEDARRLRLEAQQQRQIEAAIARQEEIQRQAEETTTRITEDAIKRTEETIDAITETQPALIEGTPLPTTRDTSIGGTLLPGTSNILPHK